MCFSQRETKQKMGYWFYMMSADPAFTPLPSTHPLNTHTATLVARQDIDIIKETRDFLGPGRKEGKFDRA